MYAKSFYPNPFFKIALLQLSSIFLVSVLWEKSLQVYFGLIKANDRKIELTSSGH